MSSPLKTIRPPVGGRTPVTQLKNVLLPAPLGPMMARISPAGSEKVTLLRAVRPPNRMVSPSVRRGGGGADTVGEFAGGWEDRLLFRHDLHDPVLAVLDLEDELAQERLVVVLAEGLVALGEVVAFLHLP